MNCISKNNKFNLGEKSESQVMSGNFSQFFSVWDLKMHSYISIGILQGVD